MIEHASADATRCSRGAAIALAVFGASAVMLGAAGAHLLAGRISATMLAVWQTSVQYQFWHTLALALALLLLPRRAARRVAVWAFAVGIVLFSGSLYALALGAPRVLGLVTPFGGLALILGWLALGTALWPRRG